ncbi:DNA polymerase sliding clamp, partial [Candidatus Micrarchaeota archaeon]|nr:DNA polymerase sliding clamp [Candidatus Micrarchaeota archaeon]MBU1930662.1 DNA polymerase sliding clamp [Candidatus Micrarchaeota archaeon]
DFSLPKTAFKTYSVEGIAKIGIALDYLAQIMARAKPNDELTLELDEQNSRLKVSFKGTATRRFSVPLIDVSSAELPIPKIDFDAELTLKADVLQDSLKDASLISTHVTMGVKSESFFVQASSSKGELNSETNKAEKGLLELKSKKDCHAMFPLDFLSDTLKAANSETSLSVFLKSNAPIKLSYKVGDASLAYFLAPRIESD